FLCPRPTPVEISPPSLHDALPISLRAAVLHPGLPEALSGSSARCAGESRPSAPLTLGVRRGVRDQAHQLRAIRAGRPLSESASRDRKSTRLNSSHVSISYAVFCLK